MTTALVARGVVVGLAATQVGIVATSVYLHRTLAHRAVEMHPTPALFFRVIVWMTTGMRRREWVAVHRMHHAAPDTARDPHSPLILGVWRVQFGLVGMYRRAARDEQTVARHARDLRPDALDRLLFDHRAVGAGLGIMTLVWLFGWTVAAVAALTAMLSYFLLNGALASFGHAVGARPHDNPGRNSRVLAFLMWGEGLHNNHHAAPGAARFACSRGDIDHGWWLVAALAWLHLARVRRRDIATGARVRAFADQEAPAVVSSDVCPGSGPAVTEVAGCSISPIPNRA